MLSEKLSTSSRGKAVQYSLTCAQALEKYRNNMHLSICHVDICLAIYFPAATCALPAQITIWRLSSALRSSSSSLSIISHSLSISFSLPSGWVLSCLRFLLFVFLLFLPLFLGAVCATQGECNAIVGRNWLSYLSHTLKVNEISASHIYIIIKTTHFIYFLIFLQ